MNKLIITAITILIGINLNAQMDSISYSIGVIVAQNLEKQGLTEVNSEDLANGLADVLNKNELKISAADADKFFSEHVEKLQAEKYKGLKEEGEKFLAENGKRAEVSTTPSGLQYEVLTEGEGEKPTIQSSVNVHYHGTLINGEVFDSSVDRGQPISFPLGNVIKGWQEGLQLMNVGSKYRLYIPYNLAYGERGSGRAIGPYSALIFDVELLGIE